jgi:hypothetical protein
MMMHKSALGGFAGARMSPQPTTIPAPLPPRQEAVREPERDRRQMADASTKLHPDVAVALLQKKASFIRNGKAELKIYLNDNTPAAVAALRNLGFEVVRHDAAGSFVIGRTTLDKVDALAKLATVRYISPNE